MNAVQPLPTQYGAIKSVPFRVVAGWCAILSAPLAFTCLYLFLRAMAFDVAALSDPSGVAALGASAAPALYWSMICDLFGYYLLLTPLTLYLRQGLRAQAPRWVDLATLGGFGYIFIGAIGAAILAVTVPPLLETHASLSTQEQSASALLIGTLLRLVQDGLWGLEGPLAGTWWLVTGWLLRRERPLLGVVTMVLGAAMWASYGGALLGLNDLAGLGLLVYLVGAPLWALWSGVSILRRGMAGN